jgi:probable HAF family extracellular repeat protein
MKARSFRFGKVGMAFALSVGPILAQDQSATPEQRPENIRYVVSDLGTLPDGPFSQAIGVTTNGVVNGASALPDGTQHAVLWYRGSITDIATPGLGGSNSGAFGINERGQASGLAETSAQDPNREDFCGYGTFFVCLPFLWHNGVMKPLPTLGGNNGEAGQINNRGEVAGNTENTTIDSTCPANSPQVFEEKPVVWKNGHVKELDTFPGDPDGWAFGINDKGQVVGASGICAPLNPQTGVYVLSRHALLWDKDTVTDLGNLGGTGAFGPGNIAGEINNRGQVVGTSDLAGDTTFHGFLWTEETGIRDLGTLLGDFASAALGINDRGEVVGVSFDANFTPRAFVRHNGRMIDLNKLAPDTPLYLLFAHGINSRSEIVGFGVNGTGEVHAFLATPGDAVSGESSTGHFTSPSNVNGAMLRLLAR